LLKFQTENEQDKVQISDTLIELLIKSAEETLRFEGFQEVTAEVDLSLTDNVGIQAINKEHREKDQVTDVLSFPQYENLKDLEELEEEYLYLGDIVISAEKAVEQAALYAHSFEREMCFLVVHSMLHLLGYDHLTPSDEAYMKELQETILDNLGITRA
jgi:probable rRNA maturation factor